MDIVEYEEGCVDSYEEVNIRVLYFEGCSKED